MPNLTIELPERIYEIVKQRAQDVNSTPEALVSSNLALLFGPCKYDRSKWLRKMKDNPDEFSVAWK